MISAQIKDGKGGGYQAKVTKRGQLVTAPLDYSTAYFNAVNAVDTAFEVTGPNASRQFVITDILLDADKNVSANTAGTIVLYEADSGTSTTATKTILTIEMLKNTARVITGINLIVTAGKWLNIKTTDATIYATILGYYVENGS
jgi:hypothetical protein